METVTSKGLEVLYSRQQIADRVAEMGAQISRDLNGEKLVMIGVLKGAAFFLVDLSRAIQAEATFDFVSVSSYGKGHRGACYLVGRKLIEYENLWPYARDLYQWPGIADTVDFDEIRAHYYRTHPMINPSGLVALLPAASFDEPANRS